MIRLLMLFAFVALCCADGTNEYRRRVEERMLAKRDSCKNLFDACRGMPRCCGTTQCYWPEGYSIRTDGYCVTCIDRSLKCQRDTQCCGDLICQKGGITHVDGMCDVGRANGAECHEDDNCASKNCHKKWYQVYGVCQA